MCAVRTTYNVYLVNVTEVNRTTAKTILQQMLSFVFRQFEVELGKKQGPYAKHDILPVDSEGKPELPADELPEESASGSSSTAPAEPAPAPPLSVVIASEILDEILEKIPVFLFGRLFLSLRLPKTKKQMLPLRSSSNQNQGISFL